MPIIPPGTYTPPPQIVICLILESSSQSYEDYGCFSLNTLGSSMTSRKVQATMFMGGQHVHIRLSYKYSPSGAHVGPGKCWLRLLGFP